MWPTIYTPTIQQMEELGFDTHKWWCWNDIHWCCSNKDEEGIPLSRTPGLYNDEEHDDLIGWDGYAVDPEQYYDEYVGQSYPVQDTLCTGRLVRHKDALMPVTLFNDPESDFAWGLPLQCPYTFGNGYGCSGKISVYALRNEFQPTDNRVQSAAAKAAYIRNATNRITKRDLTVSDFKIVCSLLIMDWPETPYLIRTKKLLIDYIMRVVVSCKK